MSRIVESLYQKYGLNESKQRRNSNRKLNEDSNFKDLALKKFKAACKKYNIEDPKVEFSDEGVAVYSPSFANFSYNDFHNFGKAAGIGYMEEADDDYAFFDLDLGESKQRICGKRKLNEYFIGWDGDIEKYDNKILEVFGEYNIEPKIAKDILKRIKLLIDFKNIESLSDLDIISNHEPVTGFFDADELAQFFNGRTTDVDCVRVTKANLVCFLDDVLMRFPEEIKDIIRKLLKKEGWYTRGGIYYYKNEDEYWRIINHWGDVFDAHEK